MCMANGEKPIPYAAHHTHMYTNALGMMCACESCPKQSQKMKTNKNKKKTKNDTTNWSQSPRMKLYKLENDNNEGRKYMETMNKWTFQKVDGVMVDCVYDIPLHVLLLLTV